MTPMLEQLRFDIPDSRIANRPPEARGLRRDGVRLLVADGSAVRHARFRDVGGYLRSGDLLVVNTSPTMNAAVDGVMEARKVVVHFSTRQAEGHWTIELRQPDAQGPILDARVGDVVQVEGGGSLSLERPVAGQGSSTRLWHARVHTPVGEAELLRSHGRPIRYSYVPAQWPGAAYQTIFADDTDRPGSAEMPSAGRPFTWQLVRRLRRSGVGVAGVSLHSGVSSQEPHEPPQPEQYAVPPETARAIRRVRHSGGRIIAVGTTVTRALETVASPDGTVGPGRGWTELVLTPTKPIRVVDGIITGWHMPEASHLSLLTAVAGSSLVEAAYQAALEGRYLWHEFGDACLLLPRRSRLRTAA